MLEGEEILNSFAHSNMQLVFLSISLKTGSSRIRMTNIRSKCLFIYKKQLRYKELALTHKHTVTVTETSNCNLNCDFFILEVAKIPWEQLNF